ncbi:unnamed protein product, partial [Larinioides sclopetarius]
MNTRPSTSSSQKFKFHYRIFVLDLMENLRFDDNPQVKSLLRETNVVVSEHPPE